MNYRMADATVMSKLLVSGCLLALGLVGCGNAEVTNSEPATQWPPGYVHCGGVETVVMDVTNPATGQAWMDRNLGASRAATSSRDEAAYGDSYQWVVFPTGISAAILRRPAIRATAISLVTGPLF